MLPWKEDRWMQRRRKENRPRSESASCSACCRWPVPFPEQVEPVAGAVHRADRHERERRTNGKHGRRPAKGQRDNGGEEESLRMAGRSTPVSAYANRWGGEDKDVERMSEALSLRFLLASNQPPPPLILSKAP
ncbi:hypothetical protein EYF80_042229 [Liparis tanakae]|uniref:Uncharacterized protein n=1 Tax=Liparis tanakae TaxID=230148 RepID=A0A4Z2G254_9TELE|nr:hypothetical protein EYF80_042229 [Liparis tanakae]